MSVSDEESSWKTFAVAGIVACFSATIAISVYSFRKKLRNMNERVGQLELSLKDSLEKCAAERMGRIRAQQTLRKVLLQSKPENLELTNFPMAPVATVRSCYTTRNGTPRQPLLVPLSRASLVFNSSRVPPSSLEGLEGYSHCWIIYVFHLNTDLEKLWKHPARSKFKAKVRVPRLKGGKMGLFATRSPHRPCPIGLTAAKVEAVHGQTVQVSGVDLVDGTPVLDVKPYLPYCDYIQEAVVPKWVKEDKLLVVASVDFLDGFFTSLAECWESMGKNSLYASPEEFQALIKQVLSWDIRSVSQRRRPHKALVNGVEKVADPTFNLNDSNDEELLENGNDLVPLPSSNVTYHLILEGLDISYRIDSKSNIFVERVFIT